MNSFTLTFPTRKTQPSPVTSLDDLKNAVMVEKDKNGQVLQSIQLASHVDQALASNKKNTVEDVVLAVFKTHAMKSRLKTTN